jgi:hypothetical protein
MLCQVDDWGIRGATRSLLILILRLLKQKVGRQLLVLVAREIGLNDCITGEPEKTQSFDGVSLFFSDGDGNGAGWERPGVAHAANCVASYILDHVSERSR